MRKRPRSFLFSTLAVTQGVTFNLPGGWPVRVEVVPPSQEKETIDDDSQAEFEHVANIIRLRGSRSIRDRKGDFSHEMQHALVDWLDFFIRKCRIKCGRKSSKRSGARSSKA